MLSDQIARARISDRLKRAENAARNRRLRASMKNEVTRPEFSRRRRPRWAPNPAADA